VLSVKSGADWVLFVGCVVGCSTVNVMLITLLLGFGSLSVEIIQVKVWVPGVACHG